MEKFPFNREDQLLDSYQVEWLFVRCKYLEVDNLAKEQSCVQAIKIKSAFIQSGELDYEAICKVLVH